MSARSRKKKTRRLPAPKRRRQLLETAAKVFATRGYRGATTAELARAAGVTEPILYRHFKSKLDLFINLLHEVGDEVIKEWETALAAAATPRERLEVILRGNPAVHERGRDVYRVIFRAMTEVNTEPTIRTALRRHITRLQRFLESEIARLQNDGAISKKLSSQTLSFLLIDVAIGFGMAAPMSIPHHSSAKGRNDLLALIEQLIVPG